MSGVSDGNNEGDGRPSSQFPTHPFRYSKTDRACPAQVAIVVQIRSLQRRPVSLRVPCVICRSITTNRIACSARLFVGSTSGVVKREEGLAVLAKSLCHVSRCRVDGHVRHARIEHDVAGRFQLPPKDDGRQFVAPMDAANNSFNAHRNRSP